MPSYLLLESGDRIILEDGSGFLLLEDQDDATPAPSMRGRLRTRAVNDGRTWTTEVAPA